MPQSQNTCSCITPHRKLIDKTGKLKMKGLTSLGDGDMLNLLYWLHFNLFKLTTCWLNLVQSLLGKSDSPNVDQKRKQSLHIGTSATCQSRDSKVSPTAVQARFTSSCSV